MAPSRRSIAGAQRPSQDCLAHGNSNATSNGPREVTGRDKRWWRLVWCHERCFLPECESRRRTLSEAARASGAALICLKRAARLQRWLEDRTKPSRPRRNSKDDSATNVSGGIVQPPAFEEEVAPPPYVLMTDYRQAITCMEAWLHQEPQHRPAFIVLLCDQVHQLDVIAPLVRDLQVSCPIYVCTEVGASDLFLNSLVAKLISSAALPASFPGPGATATRQLSPTSSLSPQMELWMPSSELPSKLAAQHQQESALQSPQLQDQSSSDRFASSPKASPYSSGSRHQQRHQTRGHSRQQAAALPLPPHQPQQQHHQLMASSPPHSSWALSPLTPLPRASEDVGDASPGAMVVVATSPASSPSHSPVPQAGTMVAAAALALAMAPPQHPPLPTFHHWLPGLATFNTLGCRQQAQAFVPPSPVDQLLGPIRCMQEDTELDRMLRAAMPESYDD